MCLVYLCESAVFCMCMDWNTCVCMGAVRRDIVQGSFDFDQHDIRNQFYRARGIRYACESACFAINGRNHTVSSSDDTYSTVQYSSSAGMVVVFMMLVVSSYYGSRYLPHGYAMITRFFSSDGADALSVRFGLLYLTIWIIALWVIGYIIVRKKDVFGRK